MTTTLAIARKYAASGINLLPIRTDGSKAPAIEEWKRLQQQRNTADEIVRWFGNGNGLAAIGGAISGNLEDFDFDDMQTFEEWKLLVIEHLGQGFWDRLLIVRTPRPGFAIIVRCHSGVEKSQKLAQIPNPQSHEPNQPRTICLIETKGEGGYFLLPGCPPACHRTGRTYDIVQGDFDRIPQITTDEREVMITCARSFDQMPRQKYENPPLKRTRQPGEILPGEDYDARGPAVSEIIGAHGYKFYKQRGATSYWTRPGKSFGISGSTGHGTHGDFYNFSSTGPFPETMRYYTKFALKAFLGHNGDFKAAARELASQGYGLKLPPSNERVAEGSKSPKSPNAEESHKRENPEPLIRVSGGSLPGNVADAERYMAASTYQEPASAIYQRSGILVHIVRIPEATVADGIRRAAGSLQIQAIGVDLLRSRLTQAAKWERFDKRSNEWIPIDAPASVARTLCESAGAWHHIPNLAGIIEAPALRPDGTVLTRPGYDRDSGLYLDVGQAEFSPIQDSPSRSQAEAAVNLLLTLLGGFPFLDDASKSVAIALLITPLVRHAVRAAPLVTISAPTMASGKTLLAHLPAYIATGRPPALMSQAQKPEEERKRLLAILLEGSTVTVIDNCERPLKSDALCTALTESVIRERVLGITKTVSAPTSTTWIATGNNLRIAGDLSSRTLLCNLDPKCERPEERRFQVNLHEYVPKHRGELAAAGLTIVRAYIAAGRVCRDIPTFGRYEDWTRLVREPLVWLGLEDPCVTRRAVENRDPVRRNLGSLLEGWANAFGSTAQTVAMAVKACETDELLKTAIETIAEDRGRINGRRLGSFIAAHENRIELGRRFERDGERQNSTLWRVTGENR